MNWRECNTEQKIALIKSVWKPDCAASYIAAQIGGVTRNAVIGIYGRNPGLALECPLQSATQVRMDAAKRAADKNSAFRNRKYAAPKKPREPKSKPTHAVSDGVSIMELTSMSCRWITNDKYPQTFCGCERERGAYCAKHAAMAYGVGTISERRTDEKHLEKFIAR